MNRLPMYREIPTEAFEQEWRAVHDAVFAGRPAHERPFRNPRWEIFLIPYGLWMDENGFNELAEAAQQVGDNEVIISADVIGPQTLVSFAIPWSYAALEEVRSAETLLEQLGSHLFAKSGSWGLVCNVDDFSCLGGEAAFMNTVAKALGGRDAIRERFLSYAAEEWGASDDFRRKALQSVDWG